MGYTPFNSANCSYLTAGCTGMCAQIDAATEACVDAVFEMYFPGQNRSTGIPPDVTVGTALLAFYAQCNFKMTSFVTNQECRFLQPNLAATYECDAMASGVPTWTAVSAVWDALSLCMTDDSCPSNWDKTRKDAKDLEKGAEFTLDTDIDWWMPNLDAMSDDQLCNIFYAQQDKGDTYLLSWLSAAFSFLHIGTMGERIGDDIADKCYNDMVDEFKAMVSKVLAIATGVSIVGSGLLVGGGCTWWFTGCNFNREKAYKADDPNDAA